MIDAVVFDMDGVLVDSEPVYFRRQIRFMQENDVIPATTNIQDYVGKSSDVVWATAIPDERDRRRVQEAYEIYASSHPMNYPEIITPGVTELMHFLKDSGYKTALASAGPIDGIEIMLETTHLKPYFDSVISGETIEHNKPDPQIYLQSLAKLGVAADHSVAMEDSFTGITAAHRAGMQAWALRPTAYTLDQSHADLIVDSMAEVQRRLTR